MLKLPQEHTDDEKANGIIARYLNENILGLVNDEIVTMNTSGKKKRRKMIRIFVKQ